MPSEYSEQSCISLLLIIICVLHEGRGDFIVDGDGDAHVLCIDEWEEGE